MSSYMKVEGIAGYDQTKVSAPNTPDPGWCPLTSCDYGVQNTSQIASGDTAGEVEANLVTVRMSTDASVIALIMRCTSGELIPSVVIVDCSADAGMTVLGRVTLTDTRVKNVTTTIEGTARMSIIQLLYRKVKFEIRTPNGAYQEYEYQNRAA